MTYAQALTLLGHRHASGRVIHKLLLYAAQAGHQLQVFAKGIALGQLLQARGPQFEQVGGGRCRNGGITADASICPGSSIVLKRSSFFSSVIARRLVTGHFAVPQLMVLARQARLTQPCSMAPIEPLIQMPA